MAAFDRETALKSAEKALRLGRIEAAIAEYVRIVEEQPRDWNSANTLGDLYVRAKQLDKGIAQYMRIADSLASEGFYPKASALYKKILKFKPDEEYALLQSADISAKQGLLADAKASLRLVAERRRTRGDLKGAAEISIRLGTLDPDDLEARLGAARAAAEIGDTETALREFREVALKLEKLGDTSGAVGALQSAFELDPKDADVRRRLLDGYLRAGDLGRARSVASGAADLKRIATALEAAGRKEDFLEVLAEVSALDPTDRQVRVTLAQNYLAKQDYERARNYLDAAAAGRNAALWLMLAEIELALIRPDEGRAAVVEALSIDPGMRDAAVALGCRMAELEPDLGYPCLDAVADASLKRKDYAGAAAALHEFVVRVRHHVVALMRLVEICVDGGLEATMLQAQAQLADAYLEAGRGLEARIISEDLVAREPFNSDNIDRFRRSLLMLGEDNADSIIAERLSGDSPFMATDQMDLNEGVFFEDAKPARPRAQTQAPAPAPAPAQKPVAELTDELELIELDSVILDEAEPAAPADVNRLAKIAVAAEESVVVEDDFSPVRDNTQLGSEEEAAAEQYGLAVTYRELGMVDDAIQALQAAAKSPRQRFDAAALLATIYLERDDIASAVHWFERAAEAPAPTVTAGRALLYGFAETLEKSGQHARALAVFVELEAEAGGYRDVAYRILRLSKLQAKR